ncbi:MULTISPECIES: tryptophan halogenase family protein [Asticcacaulis]|uniref:tryptophan halogenase family protein n=1 Tax=Asticcacaulis TaxID=76890 RepID=UPI001AE88EB8|nr:MULTISPECIES: tryptophan halogenase family protein [Asticcacaulis]MBP2161094.1 flavin-dependent dehydrogenase [Asticcacaulis solisilvae]MDR6802139.1 flavin-dependent dehydrogenase [Asticcacaulis sp. BE141]
MTSPRSILIAGGGTAGWLTACYLAKVLGNDPGRTPAITLIESPEIGVIGVGEGTFPTIRTTLQTLGIDEATFLRETTATYKQGIKFVDWLRTPKDGGHSHYLHPFDAPYWVEGAGLLPYWLLQDKAARAPFAEAVTFQPRVADADKAPKRPYEGNFSGPLNFAYHFDAVKFARLLEQRGVTLGVRHLRGTIGDVTLDDDGAIAQVTSPEHGALEADLYIDCTGFSALLIGKAMGVAQTSVRKYLFTDRAITCQVPYEAPQSPIHSYTVATAHEAGWTWDIGLSERRGVGYVYSSDHTSDTRAEEVVRAYAGPMAKDVATRIIRFDPGYRETQWVKNCVAVGLSAGFFEPLEATGIIMIEVAAGMIAEFFPHAGRVDAPADLFNRLMRQRCEKIVNFLKLHYCLTRRDEPFWRDNTADETIPSELRQMLEMWKHRPPSRFDFLTDVETFPYFSYQYILYGMDFDTDLTAARGSYPNLEAAQRIFDKVRTFGEHAVKDLPTHRELIEQVYRNGFIDRQKDKIGSKKA